MAVFAGQPPDYRLARPCSVRNRNCSAWVASRLLQLPYGGDFCGQALLGALESCPVVPQGVACVGERCGLARLEFREAIDLALGVRDLLSSEECRGAAGCRRAAGAALLVQLYAGEVEELGAGDVLHVPVADARQQRDLRESRMVLGPVADGGAADADEFASSGEADQFVFSARELGAERRWIPRRSRCLGGAGVQGQGQGLGDRRTARPLPGQHREVVAAAWCAAGQVPFLDSCTDGADRSAVVEPALGSRRVAWVSLPAAPFGEPRAGFSIPRRGSRSRRGHTRGRST